MIVIALANGFYILPLSVPLYFFILALIISVFILWHSRTTGYRCPKCQHKFEINFRQDLLSAHLPTKKNLICPACRQRVWATALIKVSKRY
jgi:hypothetical protein